MKSFPPETSPTQIFLGVVYIENVCIELRWKKSKFWGYFTSSLIYLNKELIPLSKNFERALY